MLFFLVFFISKMHFRERQELHLAILSLTTGFTGAIYWLFTPFKFQQMMNNAF